MVLRSAKMGAALILFGLALSAGNLWATETGEKMPGDEVRKARPEAVRDDQNALKVRRRGGIFRLLKTKEEKAALDKQKAEKVAQKRRANQAKRTGGPIE